MNRILRLLPLAVVLMASCLLSSCSSSETHRKVDTLVEQFNSDEFQKNVSQQPLFESAEARIDGDTLLLTFHGKPQIRFSNKNRFFIDGQRKATVASLHAAVQTDKEFRECFEAMAELGMTYKMVLRGSDGSEAYICISPEEVLKGEQ